MSKYFQTFSLDHAMWFHAKIDFSNWFLHRIDSPIAEMLEDLHEDLFMINKEDLLQVAHKKV